MEVKRWSYFLLHLPFFFLHPGLIKSLFYPLLPCVQFLCPVIVLGDGDVEVEFWGMRLRWDLVFGGIIQERTKGAVKEEDDEPTLSSIPFHHPPPSSSPLSSHSNHQTSSSMPSCHSPSPFVFSFIFTHNPSISIFFFLQPLHNHNS